VKFIMVALLARAVLAQPATPAVPPWPADNKPPNNLQGNYVFLDQAASTIVIVIPGSLRGQPDQPGEIIRVPYHNRFDPQVAVSISQAEPGQYLYVYSLANGRLAADTVNSWKVAVTCGGESFRIDARPIGWHCGRLEHSTAVHQYALPYIEGHVCPVQCFLDGQQPPDSASEQIAVVSGLRPGFTTASAEDYKGYPVMELSQELPDSVITQLAKLGDFARSSKPTITLGPRFGVDVTASQISADFSQGLNQLVRTGSLASDSGFVKQLRTALVQAAQTGRLDTTHLADPSTELEREITGAVKLSLAPGTP
jgi:hypothetical protein